MIRRFTSFALLIICGGALFDPTFAQGSLTPPTGPAPSMKTLGQIEPRVAIESLPYQITRGGAYYVTTNLTVLNGTAGISIQASDVTLDLGGFTIKGEPTSKEAVLVAAGIQNVFVRNGFITSTEVGIEGPG